MRDTLSCKEKCIQLLALADRWQMETISAVVSNALAANFDLDPIEKIAISQQYHLDRKWARDAFETICMRDDPLSLYEGSQLSRLMILLVANAREKYLCRRLAFPRVSNQSESQIATEVVADIILSGERLK